MSVAWPLTHLSLLARPEVMHYGGLSGVLHAGVAVAALGLGALAGSGGSLLLAQLALMLATVAAVSGLWTWMLDDQPARLDDEEARALIVLSTEGTHHKVRVASVGGRPVGQVRLEYGATPQTGELSYWIGSGHRGKGYGRQMLSG